MHCYYVYRCVAENAMSNMGCLGSVKQDSWITFNALTASLFSITAADLSALSVLPKEGATHRKRY